MPKYKNISKTPLAVIGVGEVKPGETIESDTKLNNAYLQEVKQSKPKTKEK